MHHQVYRIQRDSSGLIYKKCSICDFYKR